jgi:hypothetical protein
MMTEKEVTQMMPKVDALLREGHTEVALPLLLSLGFKTHDAVWYALKERCVLKESTKLNSAANMVWYPESSWKSKAGACVVISDITISDLRVIVKISDFMTELQLFKKEKPLAQQVALPDGSEIKLQGRGCANHLMQNDNVVYISDLFIRVREWMQSTYIKAAILETLDYTLHKKS